MRKAGYSTPSNEKPFDLSKVKTSADTPMRKGNRIFDIQEAPSFYPTNDEFKDPLAYIKQISPEGEKYGIIKIVPPKDYQPEFSLNTKSFRFKTRIQKLNSMEGETRTHVNYLEQLTAYHNMTGKPVAKIPQLDKRPIDLYKLKTQVAHRGGFQQVTRLKKWAEIGRNLGYARKQCTSMSNALKTVYQKIILPYEIWYAKHKDDVDTPAAGEVASDTCELCQKNDHEQALLLCDGCHRGYHVYCLNPPLPSVPKTDWYCLHCLTSIGKDYGFEDGNEYSLDDFFAFSEKFKKDWFHRLFGDDRSVTEEDCENEFWRLAENPHETCEVEYGADLHSTQHGSGYPAPELMRGEFDPWNLNVIPVASQSLFTHIKTDISGMMVPWLYIGMCFSAFCWHNEDHYTYSINYMHWGETKTWYGVPGSDTAKFEETMRKAMPELFEQQPDLLFQLVTMLSPGRLLKENVKVYAIDQRPGQFVVTFPKAYHSGFNHGFNFCEAVNFAPGEWIDYGLECAKLYKAFRKQPCFSHDELLITAVQNMTVTEDDDWLKRGLTELRERELGERNRVRFKQLKEQFLSDKDKVEESQCEFCHCYSYLSFIGCQCTDKIVCLEHMSELCACENTTKTLYLRFSDDQINEFARHVTHSCESPDEWIAKLEKTITLDPTVKTLKELLKEGYEMNVPQDSLDTLRDCIDVVDQYNTEAEIVLDLRSDDKERSIKLNELLERASVIGVDLVYFDKLRVYKTQLDEFNDRLTPHVLASGDTTLQTKLYNEGMELRADSALFNQLKSTVEASSWEGRVHQALASPYNSERLCKLIVDAAEMGMANGQLLNKLIVVEEFGKYVTQRIDNICKGREKIFLEMESSILNIGHNSQYPECSIILDPDTVARLKGHLARSRKTIDEIQDLLWNQSRKPTVMERPMITEAHRLMSLCRDLSFRSDLISELSSELTRMGAWTEQVRTTFMYGRQKSLETVLKETLSNVQRITSSEGKPSVWCICRQAESGLMIQCETCSEWYHSPCLKVPRNVARSSTTYVCPICRPDKPTKKLTYLSKQPKLEEVSHLINQSETLRFRPKDYHIILHIYAAMQGYRNRVQAFCRSRTQLITEDLPKMKYYLRTLTGLEVMLQDETEFLKVKILQLTTGAAQPLLMQQEQRVVPVIKDHPPKVISCICDKTDRRTIVHCFKCNHWFHTDCVQYNGLKDHAFKCPQCTKSPENKPQNIIRLTLKPPAEPFKKHGKKRHHSLNESSHRKQKHPHFM